MSFPFQARQGPIIVSTEVTGPSGSAIYKLALDTGATTTLLNRALLVALGYDPALAPAQVQITTASGVELVPRIPVWKVRALGQDRVHFPILCHTLPPSITVDGLLGLDFLRGQVLTLDFQNGQIMLA